MWFAYILIAIAAALSTSEGNPAKASISEQSSGQQLKLTTVGCGRPAPAYQPTVRNFHRIVGGTEAKPHSWPWLSTLLVDLHDGYLICGSNLIRVKDEVDESDILLTAAHCVTKAETQSSKPEPYPADLLSVVAGNHRRDKREDGEETRRVSEIRYHPNFRNAGSIGANNDIALVKLASPIKFSDTIRPVCLPAFGEALPVGKSCVTAGWGRNNSKTKEHPEALQQLLVPVHDAKTCHGSWWWWNPAWGSTYKDDQMICAGPVAGNSGACQGDSGGMLVCQEADSSWTLYGVTSFAAAGSCVELNKPAVFARVSTYIPWVTQNLKEMTAL